MRSIFQEMDAVTRFIEQQFTEASKQVKFPFTNVTLLEDDSLLFEFALAGYSKSSICVNVEGNYLAVTGSAPEDTHKRKRELQKKISNRDFSVSYMLPAAYVGTTARAKFEDGILSIAIPLAEHAKAKSIEIA